MPLLTLSFAAIHSLPLHALAFISLLSHYTSSHSHLHHFLSFPHVSHYLTPTLTKPFLLLFLLTLPSTSHTTSRCLSLSLSFMPNEFALTSLSSPTITLFSTLPLSSRFISPTSLFSCTYSTTAHSPLTYSLFTILNNLLLTQLSLFTHATSHTTFQFSHHPLQPLSPSPCSRSYLSPFTPYLLSLPLEFTYLAFLKSYTFALLFISHSFSPNPFCCHFFSRYLSPLTPLLTASLSLSHAPWSCSHIFLLTRPFLLLLPSHSFILAHAHSLILYLAYALTS